MCSRPLLIVLHHTDVRHFLSEIKCFSERIRYEVRSKLIKMEVDELHQNALFTFSKRHSFYRKRSNSAQKGQKNVEIQENSVTIRPQAGPACSNKIFGWNSMSSTDLTCDSSNLSVLLLKKALI